MTLLRIGVSAMVKYRALILPLSLWGHFVEFSGQFCSGSRQDFRKLGKSKLLTSSATQLNAAIR